MDKKKEPLANNLPYIANLSVNEQVAFLSSILASSTEYSIVAQDLQGKILAWNEGARRLYGYEANEIIGKNIRILHLAEDVKREFVDEIIEKALKAGTWVGEVTRIRKDKTTFVANVSITLRRNKENKPIGLTMISRNIDEEVRLKEAIIKQNKQLIETKNFLNNILDSSTEYAIIAIDLDGVIIAWNEGAKKLYQYKPEEVLNKVNLKQLFFQYNSEDNHFNEFLMTVKQKGKSEKEFELIRKSGARFTGMVNIGTLNNETGQPVGYLVIAKDITEQKRLEIQLKINRDLEAQNKRVQEATRLKSEFLANMSHELRTPLNGIIGFTELIHAGKVGPISDEQKEYLGDILTSSRHLLQLINDVLDLSKVESGKMEFHPEIIDLKKIVTEVRDVLRTFISKKRIICEIDVDSSLDEIILDPAKFKQVLYNYLSNALKFTNEGGKVYLKIKPENDLQFRIEVSDTGIGIRKEDLYRLFVEFQQLDSSVAKKYPGTGLGLALTKRIVESQGGKVGVISKFGKGSKFYAVLPRTPFHQSQILANAEVEFENDNKICILVIEDDINDQEDIKRILTNNQYAVEIAKDGRSALDLIKKNKYDAITLDLMLPDMNGWDILHAVRTVGLNRHTPIIVITVIVEETKSLGYMINDVLMKPIKDHDLLNALQKAGVPRLKDDKTVLIIDHDKKASSSAYNVLKREYKVICEDDILKGLKLAEEYQPDIIILDLLFPSKTGIDFISSYRKTLSGMKTPIIIWTSKELSKSEKKFLQSSTQAIIHKDKESFQKVFDCLRYCLEMLNEPNK